MRDFVARLKRDGYDVKKTSPGVKAETSAAAVAPGSQWEVLKGGKVVLRLKNTPGPLYGTALPPPGVEPPNHPFLSGSALDASEEDNLRRLLDASKSTADYLERLRGAGYEIRPAR